MTRKELIAEITTDLKQYDEAGLIDYRSLNLWIRIALKRFGNNIMIPTEKFLRVDNGRARLPENFWLLLVAAKCQKAGCDIPEEHKENVITSHKWRSREEQDYEWDNNSEKFFKGNYKIITEKVFFEGVPVEFKYHSPELLRLTKGMKKDICHSSCKNIQSYITSNSPYEINILGDFIQTNFRTGNIYIQYLSLPSDDEEDLIIPDTQHNHLLNYIMYHCKTKILENIIVNEDDPGKSSLLQYFSGKEREYFALAMTETKFEGLGKDWDVRLKNNMRKDTYKYELMFPIK